MKVNFRYPLKAERPRGIGFAFHRAGIGRGVKGKADRYPLFVIDYQGFKNMVQGAPVE